MLETIQNKISLYIQELGYPYNQELLKKLPKGKMLRSKLILGIAGANEASVNLCAIVEMIHAASLLHDDVIDDATTRRGEESLNALYGNKNAIMFGDVLYSKAFFELTKIDTAIAQEISSAVIKLSVGELMDVKMGEGFNTDTAMYMEMIYKKTASLIESSAISAALLSNRDVKKFGIYGKNLGLAFQIVDDILDVTQDSQKLGKPSMNDFVEGKTTLPYIYAYEALGTEEKKHLESLFRKKCDKEEEKWLKETLYNTKAIQKSIEYAKKLGYEAIEAVAGENVEKLQGVVRDMIEREF